MHGMRRSGQSDSALETRSTGDTCSLQAGKEIKIREKEGELRFLGREDRQQRHSTALRQSREDLY